ncbi:hypothetical protein CALVIDRAFT_596771 [Calocera viscosa TUFC12733]|uniref:Uncharacterized protein n=1 Tax=Calocera viscosa (strain TUFC12733) TaxID=1330018 RepID=A0A167PDZ0_CALVF|nr:hypothetical protein CALVIDRAFT_596771 [Calocera viscosa TUFC12733]
MPANNYEPVPADPEEETPEIQVIDERFTEPSVPWWKRVLLIVFILLLAGLVWLLKDVGKSFGPKVIHADRYSAEFKYRPAASPVITETLNGGKTLVIHGALPTATRKHSEL